MYVESRLVNSDEHCVRILVVPDMPVSAVELAIACEAGLISKQNLCRKGRTEDATLQKPMNKSNTRCEVVGPYFLYFLEVVCMEVLFLQDSQHRRLIWNHGMGNGRCASWGVVANSLKHFLFKRRCPRSTRSSTNAPGTKSSIFSKALIKANKHCVVRMISVWKPFLVHAESSSSISASRPVTHYHVGYLGTSVDIHS